MEKYTCIETYSTGEAIEFDLKLDQFILDEIAIILSQFMMNNQKN